LYFHADILCNYQGHWEHFDIFTLSFEILNYKSYWCVHNMCWWVASKPFRRRVLCHMVAKSSLSMSLWMCHHVFFSRGLACRDQIIVDDPSFFFFLFSHSWQFKYTIVLFLFFKSNPHSCNFLFRSYSFYRSFFCFQFSPSITISHMFCSSFWSLIFFPWPFCWSFFAFNFIIQSKFLFFYFFSIWPSFFWFVFSFVTTIFQFNLTLHLKTLIFPQINGFFFYFHPHFYIDPFV